MASQCVERWPGSPTYGPSAAPWRGEVRPDRFTCQRALRSDRRSGRARM